MIGQLSAETMVVSLLKKLIVMPLFENLNKLELKFNLLQSLDMWAALEHLEEHLHRVVVQTILINDYSCWFFGLSLLFKAIYFTLLWGWGKHWLSKDWVQFYAIHSAEHISIVIELANRLILFHVDSVSVDGIALFVFPDVGWSYLNFFGHFNI